MIFSYLKVGYNIGEHEIQVYEGDASIEMTEIEERIKTLREEILKSASQLSEIFALFRKGMQT